MPLLLGALYINPVLAQGTDGTGYSISRVPDASVWARGEDNDRVQDRDRKSYSAYNTHSCAYLD